MSIRIFKEAAFGLSLEVKSWVLSKMFDVLSDSTSHILKICMQGSKLQDIGLTMSDRSEAKKNGWTPIIMKNDWKRVFAWEQ
jgi:hypothetical protein